MNDTKTLKAKFKAAQEVTSLASSDKLMVISSDGEPKKIDKNVLTDTLTFTAQANTWYQILIGSLGGTASVGNLLIVSDAPMQEAISLDWCISRSGSIARQDLNIFNPPMGSYQREVLSKLRIRKPNSSGLIFLVDLLVTEQKRITVKLGTSINASLNLKENPQIETVYSTMEYDLTVIGGGKYLPFSKLHRLTERRAA